MSSTATARNAERVARKLGLKVDVYAHLRDTLAQGEDPVWIRTSDPFLAGMFPNALGFELLCEKLQAEEALERRRANLARALEGKELPDVEEAVENAQDEGELEDLSLALEPSPAPDGWQEPEKEEHKSFVQELRGDVQAARYLRALFREKGTVHVDSVPEAEKDAGPFRQHIGSSEPVLSLQPATYLHLRRGERAHALRLRFEMPAAEMRALFDKTIKNYPPQERESYRKLFVQFVEEERLPRYIQEARARLKRSAENLALQQAWQYLEGALDRGHHDGTVLGVCVVRHTKVMLSLIEKDGSLLRTTSVPVKDENLAAKIKKFLGGIQPSLLAVQADSATRPVREKLRSILASPAPAKQVVKETVPPEEGASSEEKKEGPAQAQPPTQPAERLRIATVPLAVVKTMLREVARRPDETHLTHDERQAVLLARLVSDPRAAAFHTPHVVRAYIQFRGEINSRRLDAFETTFLRAMLFERGVELNHGTHDMLRLVPGIHADSVEYERSTAPFRSLDDFQARMGLPPAIWRAACCFLRVRDGDEPLDARPLHPQYYFALKEALAAAPEGNDLTIKDLLREPGKVNDLPWDAVIEKRQWKDSVVDRVRFGLSRSTRRLRRPGRPQGQRLEGLTIGAVLKGTVSSMLPYGAFVDVGMRREGLLHVSEMADRFVKDPTEVVQEGQEVMVRVIAIDMESQRFRLSMRSEAKAGEEEREEGGRGGGGRGRGRGGPGGGRGERRGGDQRGGGRPGRGGGRRDGRGRRDRDDFEIGPDPRAKKKEEIDPTNPFVQFFKENKDRFPGEKDGKSKDDKESSADS